jgi:hypothetical protein
MRSLKIASIILCALALCLVAYANIRTISPSEKLKPVQLTTFVIQGELTDDTAQQLQKNLDLQEGITAAKVNVRGNLASIVHHTDVISQKELKNLISTATQSEVSLKKFEAKSGGCPVHAVGGSFSNLVALLDFRIN